MSKTFDNRINTVGDDLKKSIKKNSSLSIAAPIFSIYGFNCLKKELLSIKDLRFIFTDPAFIQVNQKKKNAKFFEMISMNSQKAISGSLFEISLKNELKGRVVAKECRNWSKNKVKFKTNRGEGRINPMFLINNKDENITYLNLNEFSAAGFGYKKDDTLLGGITKISDNNIAKEYIVPFNNIWNDEKKLKDITEDVIAYITNLYKENSPESIYYLVLFHIFNEFLEDINEDNLANEKTGFKDSVIWEMLYDFQKDAVLGLINKLEKFGGCILADSVGLGKTFSALGVIKYYEKRNKSVLVLCPKKIEDNWRTFLHNYDDNPLFKDGFNYDVLCHTDLSREDGFQNGVDLSRVNWANYDLIVLDESHNFRNNFARKDKTTRYQKLLNFIRTGVNTKVLMLSATPVNNKFTDLKNQIALAYEGHDRANDTKLNIEASIDQVLRKAQQTFNNWSKLPLEKRTSKNLLKELNKNYDFFNLLDSVTISRSRKHIEKYYDIESIGKFPKRLTPISIKTDLTTLEEVMSIDDIYKGLSNFNLSIYNPFNYIFNSKKEFYNDKYDNDILNKNTLRQENREMNLKKLIRVNFLKRLESSVDSFRITLENFCNNINKTLSRINDFREKGEKGADFQGIQLEDEDVDDWLDEEYSIGSKVKVNLIDMDIKSWKQDLIKDRDSAMNILDDMRKVKPNYDSKLIRLKNEIIKKINNQINKGNKKIIIFTAFADTANYLYKELKDSSLLLGLNSAKITGSSANENTLKIRNQFNDILSHFSPKSKNLKLKNTDPQIDVLIATDCISEGQNLQDCDTLINYDIHWNSVKIIQRFGRIDRIGSHNEVIQLINFWPNITLDDYINLKSRVETKMHMVDTTATGEDNVLTNESSEMSFRKQQLQKLQDEVVDLEDMDGSISITDLGLNDFRMDLVDYTNNKGDISNLSNGMHTVCKKNLSKKIDKGVIFVLRNMNHEVNIKDRNQLHPFYLVHIKENGDVIANHLNVKGILHTIRYLCKGNDKPLKEVYELLNIETEDGKNMDKYSKLLNKAISTIIETKDESDIDSLFSPGGTTILENEIKGIEDFELIAFFVIM